MFCQIITESVLLGLLGGLVGTSIGLLATLAICAARHWTPLLDPQLIILAPLVGILVGAIAGIYPSWRASHIPPTEALCR